MTVEDNAETIYTKYFTRGTGNEIKNSKFLTVMYTKAKQLIKHQLFTADVDIKSWLKVLYKQSLFYLTMIICFARC